jgi:hypothetical protein
MPCIGLLFLYAHSPDRIGSSLLYYLLLVTFIGTYLVPAIIIFLLLIYKGIQNLEMPSSYERRLPLLLCAFMYLVTNRFISRIGLPPEYQLYFLGIAVAALLALFINYRMKISIHMIGMGGVSGLLLALAVLYSMVPFTVLATFLLLSGAVGSARLYLESHEPKEVYLGYFVGFGSVLLPLLLL